VGGKRTRDLATVSLEGLRCPTKESIVGGEDACTGCLDPSTFLLDNFDVKEWITVTRRDRKKKALERRRTSSACRIWPDRITVFTRRHESDSKKINRERFLGTRPTICLLLIS
jgi:hypothetical protein